MSDHEILEAAIAAVSEVGPSNLTLSDVARRVGLAAPTLVQRFGSKRGLLLALASMGSESAGDDYATIRAQATSPLDALVRILLCFPGAIESADMLSNHLAFLQIDLNDPEFRQHARAHSRAHLAALCTVIAEAVAAGELRPCDEEALARALSATVGGSMLAWAIEREGVLIDWVRHDLETVLSPFRRD